MRIILNKAYGAVSDYIASHRTDKELIKIIESGNYHQDKERGWTNSTDLGLMVTTIPDDATDYDILEYDGYERVVFVVNGKIYYK